MQYLMLWFDDVVESGTDLMKSILVQPVCGVVSRYFGRFAGNPW